MYNRITLVHSWIQAAAPQGGLWMPWRPHPAQAWATPQKSSKTAATVLCPKMKVPTSTDTTPQTSKQHLPSQQIYVNTHFSGVSHR